MISQRVRGFFDLFVAMQICISAICYWLHFMVVQHVYAEPAAFASYVTYCVLFVLGLLIEAVSRYSKDSEWFQDNMVLKHRVALRQTLYAAVPVGFFLVAAKDQVISRVFLFSFMPVLYAVLLLSSWALPRLMFRWSFSAQRKDRTLLVGSSRKILDLEDWFARKAQWGLETVGVLCDEKMTNIGGLDVLGRVDDLDRVVREKGINQVIAVELPSFSIWLTKLATQCERLGVRFLVMSDLERKFRHPVVYIEHDGEHFFGLRHEALENPANRAMKRLVDFVVALPLVVFVLPWLCALVWLFQRWQSPGPLFYAQERSGFQNRRFRIIKFRTMHLNNPDAARQASADDNRIYPAGRWLRKFSLDEFPQFLNVLRGEMSVVGPRPHLRQHDEMFARVMENYFVRSFVKPGVTGLAQVRGCRGEAKDEEALQKRIESDIFYLENWSLSIDLLIIARTAWQVVSPPKTAC